MIIIIISTIVFVIAVVFVSVILINSISSYANRFELVSDNFTRQILHISLQTYFYLLVLIKMFHIQLIYCCHIHHYYSYHLRFKTACFSHSTALSC